jgi:hypothetical protein
MAIHSSYDAPSPPSRFPAARLNGSNFALLKNCWNSVSAFAVLPRLVEDRAKQLLDAVKLPQRKTLSPSRPFAGKTLERHALVVPFADVELVRSAPAKDHCHEIRSVSQ